MTSGRHAENYFVRLLAGVVVGGAGAIVLISMSGPPAAHADSSGAIPVIPVSPESLLGSSSDNLASAEILLGHADLPAAFQGVLGTQTEVLNNGSSVISEFEGTQAPLLSTSDPSLSNLGDLLFFADDQQIEQASASVLSATEAFDANPGVSTEFGLFLADAQFGGAAFETLIPNAVASFAEQLPGFGSDAVGSAAGAVDLFSSF